MEGTNGLFEIRVQLGNNIFRVFCFFDGNKLVILLTRLSEKDAEDATRRNKPRCTTYD